MTKKNRDRLLAVAKRFDRYAMRIRAYVRQQTPKRKKAVQS